MRRLIRSPTGPIGLYLLATLPLLLAGGTHGTQPWLVGAHLAGLVVMATLVLRPDLDERFRLAPVWAPVLCLPLLYAELPWLNQVLVGGYFDGLVRGWDRALLGADPASTLAARIPWIWLSELLHLSYLSFYVLALLPLGLLVLRGDPTGVRAAALGFTLATLVGYCVYAVFPVEGPRYLGSPEGIPTGPVRAFTLSILEANSSRGSAFPSGHVSIMICNAVVAHYFLGRIKWLFFTLASVVPVAVVYGGFHYAVDAAAGVVLGVGAALAGVAIARDPRAAVASVPSTEPVPLPGRGAGVPAPVERSGD